MMLVDFEWYKITHSSNFRRGFFDILECLGYGVMTCNLILGIWTAEQDYTRILGFDEVN